MTPSNVEISMGRRTPLIARIADISQVVLIIGASLYLLAYLLIALIRISYPFELEFMEGGCVVQVQRILDHYPLYIKPSLNFIPFGYTPLYFYVSSLFAHIIGNGFFPLRLVSFLSSIGCFAFIFMIVHRRTSSLYASFISSFLFAATFRIAGAWFDIARPDSLFLFLLLAGIYLFDSPRLLTRSFVAPVVVFLSFYTKQTALPVAVCLSLAALLTEKRHERFWFLACFSLLIVGSFGIMNMVTAGWYKYYVFDIPKNHLILKYTIIKFWSIDVSHLSIALCVCLISFLRVSFITDSKSDRVIRDSLILGGLFLASFLSRIQSGGYSNVLMPVYAGIAIYFGIGMSLSLKAIAGADNIRISLILVTALQFVSLLYLPAQQIPSLMHREQGEKLQKLILSFKNEVYLSDHPWYTGYLNKPVQAQDMAVRDILRWSGDEQWKQILEHEMAAAVEEERYEAIIVDFKNFSLRPSNFDAHYKLVESNLCEDAFQPLTGWDRMPRYLYVRRTVQSGNRGYSPPAPAPPSMRVRTGRFTESTGP
jgi:hypothetical protein